MSTRFEPDEIHDVEQRLSVQLESLAPQPRPGLADLIRSQVGRAPQRSGLLAWIASQEAASRWQPSLLAAAIIVVAVGIGVEVGRSPIETTLHASPRAQPNPSGSSASPIRTGSPEPAAAIYQKWNRSDLPQGTRQARGIPHGVVEFLGRLLVVGGAETGHCSGAPCVVETTAAVWVADHGGWRRLPDQPGFGAGAMNAVAASSNRLLVLGSTTKSPKGTGEGLLWPELWVSDDGLTFRPYDAPAQFTTISAADSSFALFLAASSAPDGTGLEIWRSMDGLSWERVADERQMGPGYVSVFRRLGISYVGVGVPYAPNAQGEVVGQTALWLSAEGQRWRRIPAAGIGEVSDVAGSEGHMVAVGRVGGDGKAWISEDAGATWLEAKQPPFGGHPLGSILEVPGGFIAIGDPRQGTAGIWTSDTGEHWYSVPEQSSIGSDDFLGSIALQTNGNLAMVGIHDPGSGRAASVWTSVAPWGSVNAP